MLSSLSLVQRCEEADVLFNIGFAETLLHLKPETQAAFAQIGDGCCVFAGEGSPLNKATGVGMHDPVSAADFARIEEFFRTRNTISHIDFSAYAHPSFLASINERGYVVDSFTATFVLSPAQWLPTNIPDGIVVREPRSDEAEVWMETLNRGFMESHPIPPVFADIALVDFYHPATRCFIAEIDGVPVGAGCLAMIGTTATLFATSTLPSFRQRGVQTALLHHRLRSAREAGCELARVIARPGSNSQRNIERFGFRMIDIRTRFALPVL